MPPVDPTPLRWYWLTALLIAAAVVGVYWNTLGNEFLTFDDRKYIYENELVIGEGGLGAIWGDLFNERPKLHYNPMTYSTFWIEHALVGLEPLDVDPQTVADCTTMSAPWQIGRSKAGVATVESTISGRS